ncbi:hypothetical protein GCK72_019836 [Caenorhabditis remanei]|uniref:Uncharacterized protein n=1 Tax=Caenorhabditis remanei TaxID=31234 RepID=A0A6A5GDY0_CAERE|nr:hypothetical protein GCK72_019836 [Caenorhabditis remanei]KAF1753280.1 hypothetical protein GCK72_019836 [Caenorhabditis remanei]
MDGSNDANDENKRPDVKSPAPKSPFRIGARLFGNSIANCADENLEDTCTEFDSPNLSRADAEEIDENLEQTKIGIPFVTTTHNLSVVEESDERTAEDDETDGNISQDDNVFVQEDEISSPTRQLSEIKQVIDDSTATTPILLASQIDKGHHSINIRSVESELPQIVQPEPQIDYSLHEFELIEMKVEYDEMIKMFQNDIEEGKAREEALKQSIENNRQYIHELESNVQKLADLNQSNVSELSVESERRNSELTILQSNLVELSAKLEIAQADLSESEKAHQETIQNLKASIESSNISLVVLQEKLDDAVSKCNRRETELISQAQQHQEQLEKLQLVISENQNTAEQPETEELHARIEEMQASINFAQNAIETANYAQATLRNELQESEKKLEAAEEALTVKENTIITLESRIEAISREFEGRLEEADQLKAEAMRMETMTASLSDIEQQVRELTAELEEFKRRVIEAERTAQNDVTSIRDEKKEQSIALDEAKTRIVMLEKKLKMSEKEVGRLGKLCDDFDDEEQDYREEIVKLKAEIKQLKLIKSPMGALEEERISTKPQDNDDVFEDAQDSFQSEADHQSVFLRIDAADEMVHPDDKSLERPESEISPNPN